MHRKWVSLLQTNNSPNSLIWRSFIHSKIFHSLSHWNRGPNKLRVNWVGSFIPYVLSNLILLFDKFACFQTVNFECETPLFQMLTNEMLILMMYVWQNVWVGGVGPQNLNHLVCLTHLLSWICILRNQLLQFCFCILH